MTDDELRARWDEAADRQEQRQIDSLFYAMMITERRARSIQVMRWLCALEGIFMVVGLITLAIEHL